MNWGRIGGGLSSWWGELGHKPGGRPGKGIPIFSLEPLWRGSPFQIALNGNLFTSNAPFWNSGIRGGGAGLYPPSMGSVSNGVCCVWFDCAMDIPNNAIALLPVRRLSCGTRPRRRFDDAEPLWYTKYNTKCVGMYWGMRGLGVRRVVSSNLN